MAIRPTVKLVIKLVAAVKLTSRGKKFQYHVGDAGLRKIAQLFRFNVN